MKKHVLAISGALAALTIAGAAQADVVCNQQGDCWRVKERRTYGPELRLSVHPDNWRWEEKEGHRYRWRDAGHGHGYWRDGAWIVIK